MLLSRIGRRTCKSLIVLSLLWLLINLLNSFKTKCYWGDCKKVEYFKSQTYNYGNRFNETKEEKQEERVLNDKENDSIYKYKRTILKRWLPASLVLQSKGAGEMGEPVYIPFKHNAIMIKKFSIYNFNVLASDSISIKRSLPDVRPEDCKRRKYPEFLPTTSVVIVFHNEAWSTLLRTVWSTINRSPRSLLREIILVDDASDARYLGKDLEEYVAKLPVRVHLLRTENRYGLVKARLLAVEHVTGQVITFLDSHCECTEGWLLPLLARLEKDRRIVASPVIDTISKETFEYVPSSNDRYGDFDWHLQFKWHDFSQTDPQKRFGNRTVPIRTPVIGGIFSIDKKYFKEIGSYDERMDFWGMENLELSFRIWQCGGVLEIVPCSRVGHVSKDQTMYYSESGYRRIFRNANRVAQVWMENWSNFYYATNPYARLEPAGDLSSRINLRKKLNCKSFRWYLENVHPESTMPLNYYYLGEIRNVVTGLCLDTMGRKEYENLGMSYCQHLGDTQIFVYTKRYKIISNGYCLEASSPVGPIQLRTCQTIGARQIWVYDFEKKTINNISTGNCLTKTDDNDLCLEACNDEKNQRWLMIDHFRWQVDQKGK